VYGKLFTFFSPSNSAKVTAILTGVGAMGRVSVEVSSLLVLSCARAQGVALQKPRPAMLPLLLLSFFSSYPTESR
jgi:hypothetical protein